MRIPRIYSNQHLIVGDSCKLDSAASHYAANVLRMSVGRPLIVFNGKGGEYRASVSAVSKKSVAVAIEAFVDIDRESPLHTELAIGLSKGERMDWLIQKSTELGISSIVPLLTERTEVKLSGERLDKKMRHWRSPNPRRT